MKKYILFWSCVAGLLLMMARVNAQNHVRPFLADPDGRCTQWVDSVMAGMSLEAKVGQLVVATVPARMDKETKKLVRDWAKKYKIGGLLFGEGTVEDQVQLTNLAQKAAEVPLLIAVEGEWGLHLTGMPRFPRNVALGCIGDNALIEAYGREMARELRLLGVQVNLAPVADVNTNPFNPFINVRSFGENPVAVAEKVAAYGRGLQSGGVLAVVSHFPGHGDTDLDSRRTLPVLRHSRQRLDSVELYPFRQAFRAGLGGVMVGHLQVPALDSEGELPASLSRKVVTDLLKNELGFQGLVFTDALDMRGVTRVPGYRVKAVQAGNDILLAQDKPVETVTELLAAVQNGQLSEKEIDARCRKVLASKYQLGLRTKAGKLPTNDLGTLISSDEARVLASRLRREAVTVLDNCFGMLPLAPAAQGKGIAVLSMGGEKNDSTFVAAMQGRDNVDCFRLPWNASVEEQQKMSDVLNGYSRVVVSIAGIGYVSETDVKFLTELDLRAPLAYVFFTSYRLLPTLSSALGKANAVVLAHSSEDDVQAHVAKVLFAEEGAHGRLPMRIGRLYPAGTGCDIEPGSKPVAAMPDDYGMNSYVLEGIDRIARKGLEAGAYPGCRILIWKDGNAVYDKGFGQHSDKDSTEVRSTDLFDLGALTKTTATLLAVMKLYDEGKLKLDDKVSAYLSYLRGTDKCDITIRQLLFHESGLPPYIRFYMEAIDPNSVHGPYAQSWKDQWHQTQVSEHSYYCSDFKFKRGLMADKDDNTHTVHVADGMWLNRSFKSIIQRSIARCQLQGRRYVESDLGFILLQQVVEQITKLPLDAYVTQAFYAPMGLQRTLFCPLEKMSKADIMPTVSNDFLRRQDLCGYVQDETAAFMGGVAGHAGLFSTVSEVAAIYQMLLDGGVWKGQRLLSEETCRLFTTEKSSASRRGLGFDKPDVSNVKRSPCAPSTPATVYGHTGFTGTCVWVDPESRTVYVFLSNRMCPNVWNTKLGDMDIMTDIQELIFNSLAGKEK